MNFASPAHDGGAGLIDFVVQDGTDPSFASRTTTTTGTGHNAYNVTTGQVCYARIFFRTAVTNAAGAWSAPSGTGSTRERHRWQAMGRRNRAAFDYRHALGWSEKGADQDCGAMGWSGGSFNLLVAVGQRKSFTLLAFVHFYPCPPIY